ncbi:MAG: gliding motility-associated C-terminal domain-containing protein, partial [Bacteroidetes bacterium]|nr:gliding motility-associated C-terminal domain-containing protein [Bacteroidota bacterium]
NPVSVFDPVVHVYDKSGENSTYFWSLGDGSTSVLNNFYHTYSDKDTGRYLITVTAINAGGCTDTASLWVIVRPDGTFYVPNAFTPDGDGLNDIFKAYGIGILEFEMSIYDRWGKQIYHSKNMNEGWDGRIDGELAPKGTFAYIIVYKEFSGIRHTKSGAISVIR